MEKVTGSKRGVSSRLKAEQRMVNRTEGKKGGGEGGIRPEREKSPAPPGPDPDSQITEEYSMKRQPV